MLSNDSYTLIWLQFDRSKFGMRVLKSIQVLSFSDSRHLALVLIMKTAYIVATNNLKLLSYCTVLHG